MKKGPVSREWNFLSNPFFEWGLGSAGSESATPIVPPAIMAAVGAHRVARRHWIHSLLKELVAGAGGCAARYGVQLFSSDSLSVFCRRREGLLEWFAQVLKSTGLAWNLSSDEEEYLIVCRG